MSIVNSEGEVPSDLAEEPAMKDLLLEQVKKQGNRAQTQHPGTGHVCAQCSSSVSPPVTRVQPRGDQ